MIAAACALMPPRILRAIPLAAAGLPWPGRRERARAQRLARAALLREPLVSGEPDAAAFRSVASHAVFVAEFLAELGGRVPDVTVETAVPLLPESRRRGLLVLTLHVGNWIAGARALANAAGPLATVAGVQLRASWQRAIGAHLGRVGVELVPKGGAGSRLRDVLRGGGVAVLHLDGDPDPSAPPRTGSLPPGVRSASFLAARTGARVVYAECTRGASGSFGLHLRPLGTGEGTREEWVQVLTRVWRDEVRRRPEEWMIFRSDPRLSSLPG